MNYASPADIARWGYNAYNMANSVYPFIKGGNLRGTSVTRNSKYRSRRRGRRYRGLTTPSRSLSTHAFVRRAAPIILTINPSSGITQFNLTNVTTPAYGFAMYFCLDAVQVQIGTNTISQGVITFTDLTTLYDMYKIDQVALDLYYESNDAFVSSVSQHPLPLLQTAIDFDDTTAPTTNNELTQYSSFKLDAFGDKSKTHFRHVIRPKVQTTTVTTSVGGTAGIVSKPSMFIDTATPDVAHTGFKGLFNFGNNGSVATHVTIMATYYISMKSVK